MDDSQLQETPAGGLFAPPPEIQTAGFRAYQWGWPLVNASKRAEHAKSVANNTMIVLGGVPLSYGHLTMLTGYMSLEQRVIACPNQDTVYGAGVFDLSQGPIVFQIPDFSEQLFWSYAFYDARTDEFGQIGKQDGSQEGFYLLVGPNWDGVLPTGIPRQNVVPSKTDLAFAVVRIFVKDPVAEQAAILQMTRRIAFYPKAEFQAGTWTEKDWSTIPQLFPHFWDWRKDEAQFVKPETFFVNELPDILDNLKAEPWEAAQYAEMNLVVDYARRHRIEMRVFGHTAEGSVIAPLMAWQANGVSSVNGWNVSSPDAADWGHNYTQRAAAAKSNMFESRPESTKYFFTDNDSQGEPLSGSFNYEITFPNGQLPADYVNAFWSISLYDEYHFFNTVWNPVKQYSLGTKNGDDLKPGANGLILYAGGMSPGADKEKKWLPAAPDAPFSLYIRMYWPKPQVIDGAWKPPTVVRIP